VTGYHGRRVMGLLLVGVVGCTVGSNDQMPDLSVPATWTEVQQSGVTLQPIQVTRWWTAFNDPRLEVLLAQSERTALADLVTLYKALGGGSGMVSQTH